MLELFDNKIKYIRHPTTLKNHQHIQIQWNVFLIIYFHAKIQFQ